MGPKEKHILALDIGGSKLLAGILDYNGNIIEIEKKLLGSSTTEEYLKDNVKDIISKLLDKTDPKNIDRSGVSVPGLADKKNSILVFAPYSGIRDFPIGKIINEMLQIPVFVENDANACAIGEMEYGGCKDVDDFIWITVSNGVGGAIVINKELFEGCCGGAGEIGHIVVEEGGYKCGCGNRGCLEAYAAGPAILRRYIEKKGDKKKDITAKEIAQAAKEGDLAALDIYKKTGYYLGKAISYAVNLINPSKVIIGGGIAMDLELLEPEIQRVVDSMVFLDSNKDLVIQKTVLSYEAALIGAAAVAKKRKIK